MGNFSRRMRGAHGRVARVSSNEKAGVSEGVTSDA